MNTNYPKINTLFKRDEKNRIIVDEFTFPEFRILENCKWECSEKIDGTNIHCDVKFVNGELKYSIEGRTENAQIPTHLYNKLEEIFNQESLSNLFEWQITKSKVTGEPFFASIYGEGYGRKIQKGGNYIKDDVGFILFDVKVGHWWLEREQCEEIAASLSVPIVSLIGYFTLTEAIGFVKTGFKSRIAENKNYDAEGLVLKAPKGILFRNGSRIITKLKTSDFRKLEA